MFYKSNVTKKEAVITTVTYNLILAEFYRKVRTWGTCPWFRPWFRPWTYMIMKGNLVQLRLRLGIEDLRSISTFFP